MSTEDEVDVRITQRKLSSKGMNYDTQIDNTPTDDDGNTTSQRVYSKWNCEKNASDSG